VPKMAPDDILLLFLFIHMSGIKYGRIMKKAGKNVFTTLQI